MRSESSDTKNFSHHPESHPLENIQKDKDIATKDYSTFDDDFQVVTDGTDKVYGHGASQTIILKSKAEGNHPPTTIYYRSLFDIDDSTDEVENFDFEQDKINLSDVMRALGEDLSLDHVKFVLSNKKDLKLIVYDGPIGNGSEYHVLTLKSAINSKNTSINSLLKKCIIL